MALAGVQIASFRQSSDVNTADCPSELLALPVCNGDIDQYEVGILHGYQSWFICSIIGDQCMELFSKFASVRMFPYNSEGT